MENIFDIRTNNRRDAALTGEILFESVHHSFPRASLKKEIHATIQRRIRELHDIQWASFLVIFSPGQDPEEIRCQVDVETDGQRSAFAVGYGPEARLAFHDAGERMQWFEKNLPIKMII